MSRLVCVSSGMSAHGMLWAGVVAVGLACLSVSGGAPRAGAEDKPAKAADGAVIGAIGVSGSTVENDHTVATAGAGAIK